jgi:hypothetical protein
VNAWTKHKERVEELENEVASLKALIVRLDLAPTLGPLMDGSRVVRQRRAVTLTREEWALAKGET